MKRVIRRIGFVLLALLGIVLSAGAVLLATALYALRAKPGDWSVRAALGPVGIELSVPALLRVATHPLGIRMLAGHRIATRYGTLHARPGTTPSSLVVRCAPCIVDARWLAAQPIRIAEIEASVEHGEPNQLHGELRLGRVRAAWQARLAAQSADLEVKLADAAVADIVTLLGSAVPEAARARIEGRAGATGRRALPSSRYAIEPRLEWLTVEGLGSDALIAATPTPACARAPRVTRSATPYGTWLPKAVIAAEDPRFWLASLLRNPEAELDRAAAQGLDAPRLASLADALRPMPRTRREDLRAELAVWSPPPVVLLRRERLAIGVAVAASSPEGESLSAARRFRSALRSPG